MWHFDAVWIFPQKCAPSVGRNKPMTRSLKKTQKVKANAQGYSHLPTNLMVSMDRYENYLSKKVSLGTQIFILCQIWQLEKQFYEKVNKFWLVNYEIEQVVTYKKSHSETLKIDHFCSAVIFNFWVSFFSKYCHLKTYWDIGMKPKLKKAQTTKLSQYEDSWLISQQPFMV